MTRATKLISLLLLTSLGVGVYAEKKSCKNEAACATRCCKKECKKNNRIRCDFDDLELAFKTTLTFDQLIVEGESRPESDRPADPGTGDNEVTGTFEICFEKDMSRADYRLTICNVNFGDRNRNERVNYAALVLGSVPLEIPFNFENPIAFLGNFTNFGATQCGKDGTICIEGSLTNQSLNPTNDSFTFIPTIATLYFAIREGFITALIGGSNGCDPRTPARAKYGLTQQEPFGLISGSILSARMTGFLTGFLLIFAGEPTLDTSSTLMHNLKSLLTQGRS